MIFGNLLKTSLGFNLACFVAGLVLPYLLQSETTPATPAVVSAQKPAETPAEPPPEPKPASKPIKNAAWLTIITGPDKMVQCAEWRVNVQIRAILEANQVNYKALLTTDQLIDQLKYRPMIESASLPVAIIQADNGKVLEAISFQTTAELLQIAASTKP